MHDRIPVALMVNGRNQDLSIEPHETLADVLRERLGLTGLKISCDAQVCGACTVLVDGLPVSACTFLAADADGRRVRTVEGLAVDGVLSPLQQAFIDHAAFQCGFCTPGMLMAATALLDEQPQPTRDDVVDGLEGNLCRCTGYVPIVDAVLARGGRRRDEAGHHPGRASPRRSASRCRAGTASPRSPGRPASRPISTSPAWPTRGSCGARTRTPGSGRSTWRRPAAHPGVIAVVSAADLADVNLVYGHAVADHPLIAVDVVRFAGEPVVGRRGRGRGHGRGGARPDRRRLRAAAVRPRPSTPLRTMPRSSTSDPASSDPIVGSTRTSSATIRTSAPRRARRGATSTARSPTPTSSSRATTATRCATPTPWSRTRPSRPGARAG